MIDVKFNINKEIIEIKSNKRFRYYKFVVCDKDNELFYCLHLSNKSVINEYNLCRTNMYGKTDIRMPLPVLNFVKNSIIETGSVSIVPVDTNDIDLMIDCTINGIELQDDVTTIFIKKLPM